MNAYIKLGIIQAVTLLLFIAWIIVSPLHSQIILGVAFIIIGYLGGFCCVLVKENEVLTNQLKEKDKNNESTNYSR